MCGIFGYIGPRNAPPLLLDGLKTLEYRGYDSAGMFIVPPHSDLREGSIKAVGAVGELAAKMPEGLSGTCGIAHTRWATHGQPNERNAHPHTDSSGSVQIVHNGIIENYRELREWLEEQGAVFVSETDTEVLAQLIAHYAGTSDSFEGAVVTALHSVRGTYGLAAISTSAPEQIVAARMGSPIVLGVGDGEQFVASDPSAVLRHTKQVIHLEDGEAAVLTPDEYRVFTLDRKHRPRTPETLEWDIEDVQKGGYPFFMEKEIMEAPSVLADSARGRLIPQEGLAKLGGLEQVADQLKDINRVVIVACGSAYYAGLIGKYMLEQYAGLPTEVDLGSEFRYRNAAVSPGTAVLAISQSGETADTLASIREAKRRGHLTLGLVNVVGSTIARETDAGVYNHAGPEIGVASTKAFLSQVEVLALLTLFLGRERTLSYADAKAIAEGVATLPETVGHILARREQCRPIGQRLAAGAHALYIGRTYNLPTAYEGALKLKEVSYVHAEGYGAGEMKHGPLAMIDEQFPTVALAPSDSVYEKMISNIEEIRTRRGPVIALATEGNTGIAHHADEVVYVPAVHEMLSPIVMAVPLQLIAYYAGVAKGYDVDKPRNLAKSVTVE